MTPIEAIIESVKEIIGDRFEVSLCAGDGWFDGFSICSNGCHLTGFEIDEPPVIKVRFSIPYEKDENDTFDMCDAADLDRLFARVSALFGPDGAWN